MTFYYKDLDITYIFDLLKLTEKLAITPPLSKEKQEMKKFKYYHIVVVAILLSGCAFSVYGIVVYFFPYFTTTNAVLRLLCVLGISVLNLVTVVVAVVNAKTWNCFLKHFKHLDKKLGYTSSKDSGRPLKFQLIANNLVMFCMCGYDGYVWYNNYHWKLFRFYIPYYLNFCHSVLTVLVILHFATALAGRYKKINNLLIKSNDLHNIFNSLIPKGSIERLNNLKSIKEVTDYYILLSELVDMFNRLFGWQILFVTELLIIMLLDVSNNLMLSFDPSQKSSVAFHDFRTIFSLVLLSVMIISYHSVLIKKCEDVNKESRNTLSICYNLQETVDPTSEERKELIILSDVVSLLKTRTNAAGFYDINRTLSSRVFSYLFSYSIVLIQFNKQYVPRDQVKENNTLI